MSRVINTLFIVSLFIGIFAFSIHPVQAQQPELIISLRRDFGYSSGAGDIQGRFSMTAEGPDDIARVIYYLDDQEIGTASEPPYRLQFNTDNFPSGQHNMSAIGVTDQGNQLLSNTITRNFVSSDTARSSTFQYIIYIVGGIGVTMFIAYFIINWLAKNAEPLPLGAPRQYGYYGGAICPKCNRPYSMHVYGLNLLTHRYDRCEHCGKWSLVQRASPDALAAAEQAEVEDSSHNKQKPSSVNEVNKRRQQLDDSRFQDW